MKQFSKMLIAVGFGILSVTANPQLAVAQVVAFDLRHDASPPLKDLVGGSATPANQAVQTRQVLDFSAATADPPTGLTIVQNFPGFAAPGGPLPNIPASDTSGAAGPNHYMQTVNFAVTVFDKNGNIVQGPFSTAAWWNGFPVAPCAQGWSDEVVLYDHAAERWFISRFARGQNADATVFYWYQCFAISMTSDPTGQYHRYAAPLEDVSLVMRQGDGHSCSGALHSTMFPVKREHQAILIAGICKFIDSETERLKNWIIQRAANKCSCVWRYYMQV